MRFSGTGIVCTDTRFQFCRTQEAIGFRDGPFAMDLLRLNRVQPRAFHRQSADGNVHASLARFHLLIVGADPRVDGLAGVPRGVIPDEQSRRDAWLPQAGAAPGQKVDRHSTDRASGDKPPLHLLDRRLTAADQQPITRQGVRVGILLGPRQLLEAGSRAALHPTVLGGWSQAAPPDCIANAQGPCRLLSDQPAQAVALFFFRRSAGSGLVLQWLARFQRTPSGWSARRMASPLTWRGVSPWA